MLKFEIDTLDGLDEATAKLYTKHGDKYRLSVEGIDPADELKEALRKEREEKAEEKRRRKELEDANAEAERKRMEEGQQFQTLYETEQKTAADLRKQLDDMKAEKAKGERKSVALQIRAALTKDEKRGALIEQEALKMIAYVEGEGVKINGPDGAAWDDKALAAHIRENYPFLVDGTGANGGGANGGGGSGGVSVAEFTNMSGAARAAIRRENPAEYDRLVAAEKTRR